MNENSIKATMVIGVVFFASLIVINEVNKRTKPKKLAVATPVVQKGTEVLFSPHGGCTDRIVRLIDAAKVEVRVQAYTFTSQAIADALQRAKERKLIVEIVLDKKENEHDSQGDEMESLKIPVYYDSKHAIAHNKLIMIDATTVIGGSFNYSDAAESRNAENVTIMTDPNIASLYLTNYKVHRGHSVLGPLPKKPAAKP